MTKQEEIREGLARRAYKRLKSADTPSWDNLEEDCSVKRFYLGLADYQRDYLHSQGVVIKVDRELPRLRDYDKRPTTSESVDFQDGFILAKAEMLKAGCVAVEPLIEEEQNGRIRKDTRC